MRNKTTKLLAISILPAALLLSSCSSEPESAVPTAVLDQTLDAPYGKTETVQENLRESADLAMVAYEAEKTLNLGSDYFNVRHQDISYSTEWPTSLGLGHMHIVSVFSAEDRLLFASKDVSGVCWYTEITVKSGEPVVRYGASNDSACTADKTDDNLPSWETFNFPLSAPVTDAPAASDATTTTPSR
jgi:hypothetical protein